MATNSIIDNLNSRDIISTIKLEMGADINKQKVFLVVEGQDDKSFFKYFCNENVSVCESYSGKKGIEEILQNFTSQNNILGVRDKDYEQRILDKRILFYDFCNIEMMFIKDDETFERLVCEHYKGDKKYTQLREEILHQLILISELRRTNEKEKKMWNFNGINYEEIINEDDKVNIKLLQEKLIKINGSKKDIQTYILKKENEYSYEELLNITNGHDFLKMISACCNKKNKVKINEKNIMDTLRKSFGKSNFRNTKLYSDLEKYQKENKIKIV